MTDGADTTAIEARVERALERRTTGWLRDNLPIVAVAISLMVSAGGLYLRLDRLEIELHRAVPMVQRVGDLDRELLVLKDRVERNTVEVQRRLERIEAKLDSLIERSTPR